MDTEELVELLFFDTFSHEINDDINLDLVQFPKPVYITEIRIIPLGARVQADFPGGVRLGATNPSKFDVEFFVNDLGKPGACTFERLGNLDYNQNDRINLECHHHNNHDKIPTDGLVLRGWYTTITLAVYGTLTKNLVEPIASPPSPPLPLPSTTTTTEQTSSLEETTVGTTVVVPIMDEDEIKENQEWQNENLLKSNEVFQRDLYKDDEISSFDENLKSTPHNDGNNSFYHDETREHDKKTVSKRRSLSSERSQSRNRTFSRSNSNEQENLNSTIKQKREWSHSPDYRHSRHISSSGKHDKGLKESENSERKRPKTPPQINSPRQSCFDTSHIQDNLDTIMDFNSIKQMTTKEENLETIKDGTGFQIGQQRNDDNNKMATIIDETQEIQCMDDETLSQDEPFEPILSDDEIIGDDDNDEQDNDDITMDNTADAVDTADADFDDNAIKIFDPFKMEIKKYTPTILKESYFKECEILKKIFRKYELQTQIDKRENFLKSTSDEKENFIHITEELLSIIINLLKNLNIKLLLEKLFKMNVDDDDDDDNEMKYLQIISNIIKISLDFELACTQLQPGYKIRHIKCGIKLIEYFGSYDKILIYLLNEANCNPFNELFKLYKQNYMALSIKLMILKSIYSLIDTKYGVKLFLNNTNAVEADIATAAEDEDDNEKKLNGYQQLLLIMNKNSLTRVKFFIKSVLKKLHLYEALEKIHEILIKNFVLTQKLSSSSELSYNDLEICLNEIINALILNKLNYQQPKHFLPVTKKFQINLDNLANNNWYQMIKSYFKIHSLAESILLIITNQCFVPSVLLDKCYDLIEYLLMTSVGIDYFVEDCFETTQLLIKCLLNPETSSESGSEVSESEIESQKQQQQQIHKNDIVTEIEIEKDDKRKNLPIKARSRAQKIGVHLSFVIQTRYHLNAIKDIDDEDNADLLIEHLHSLYSQTCYYPGRNYTIETICMNNNIQILLNLIEKEKLKQSKYQEEIKISTIKYKSPVLSYLIDLLDRTVRNSVNLDYLLENHQFLLDLIKNHEIFESSVSAVLQEMSIYLKPLEILINFTSYDDIGPLCDIIKRSMEYITTFPGDLIMSLRILQYFTINSQHLNRCNEITELKYRYVLLQFYSCDGVVILMNILEKLNSYYEQPGLHSPILMTTQGYYTCQILLPTIRILRELLTLAIKCRDAEFKDITVIEHLMRTYCLMYYYPEISSAYSDAQLIKNEIIKLLLAYTQPKQQQQNEELIHKSLWTQMIHEVLKSILNGPSTFIPGLQAFAELLPLPLPIPTLKQLTTIECKKLIIERKLWSAHLHPESTLLTELISTICPTSFPQLSDLLLRVCLQLADLAPNMTLLISKIVNDLINKEFSNGNNGIGNNGGICGTPLLARLLKFLSQLTAYPSVKISTLSIFSNKMYEYFNQILTNVDNNDQQQQQQSSSSTSSSSSSSSSSTSPASSSIDYHSQCQQNIYQIFENFFDSEITMISANPTNNLELNLSCSLPSREFIPGIITSIVMSFLNLNLKKDNVILSALRTLIILTEHNITFFHLRKILLNQKCKFQQWLQNLIIYLNEKTKNFNENLLSSLILFLRSLIQIDESNDDLIIPNRTMKLTINELNDLCNIQMDYNPFKIFKNSLENQEEIKNIELIQDCNNFLQLIGNQNDTTEQQQQQQDNLLNEPILPQAEGIVTQYFSRSIYSLYEILEDDSQLNANYWLEPIRLDNLNDEIFQQLERIPCDLNEMATTYLSSSTSTSTSVSETNLLSSECKRILHLSASPQSNRERTTTAPCFRTRRVEVEPTTGRPEKKIYISPMRGRGFPRVPPSRGDLFRSRPPNTSRPPSLHVDDFLALETCGAQPTGPTGYNKLSRDLINIRGTRSTRSRGLRIATGAPYRTASPSTWSHVSVDSNTQPQPPLPQHFRTATSEPVVVGSHFTNDSSLYTQPHFGGGMPVRSRGRGRIRTFIR